MHAAKAIGGLVERTRRCLDAGCDLALVCLPDDVKELLDGQEDSPRDATDAIARLYGRPTVDRDELIVVRQERIREWDHWRHSLEQLENETWV